MFLDPQIYIHPEQQARIPRAIGLHIPIGLREYRYSFQQKTLFFDVTGDIEIGRILTLALYNVLASNFSGLAFLEKFSPGQLIPANDIQLVAVPAIDELIFVFPRMGFSSYAAHVALSFTFHNLRGQELHRIRATGESSYGMSEMLRDSTGFSFTKKGLSPYQMTQISINGAFEMVLKKLSEQMVHDREKIFSLYPVNPSF